MVPLDKRWFPLSEKPDHYPQNTNRSVRRCIWRYRFWVGVWRCRILTRL
jgi:hypothetical protein